MNSPTANGIDAGVFYLAWSPCAAVLPVFTWKIKPYLAIALSLQPHTWVQFQSSNATTSREEALLLCQTEAGHWLAWSPDQGEFLLEAQDILPTGSPLLES
jgi:hypothetical protein